MTDNMFATCQGWSWHDRSGWLLLLAKSSKMAAHGTFEVKLTKQKPWVMTQRAEGTGLFVCCLSLVL